MAAASAPRLLIFCSCANFCFFHTLNYQVFGLYCTILGIFANFARFWPLFAHILCASFSDLKFCVCYFVSFFHLWPWYIFYMLNIEYIIHYINVISIMMYLFYDELRIYYTIYRISTPFRGRKQPKKGPQR